ncbi:GlcNAc-PI de-N-acetylase, partial [Tessaracoccus bendigoensis DSM 12906]
MTHRYRSTVLPSLLALGIVLSGVTLGAASAQATGCSRSILTIVAHQDDDLLFMNPDIENELTGGACATTVFVTAGDAGAGATYWEEREQGPQSAYATMLGLSPSIIWDTQPTTFSGHSMKVTISPEGGMVRLINMRLPDGTLSGNGTPATGHQSLRLLRDGSISSVTAVDGSTTYTSQQLIDTLRSIIADTDPDTVRVQDARPGQSDHPDHLAAGQYALEALAGFTGTVQAYRGYNVVQNAANVAGTELTRKTATLLAYAEHDPYLCASLTDCPAGTEALWNERQYPAPLAYPIVPEPGPAPYNGPNSARNAAVLASSQAPGQEATKAIDSIISGWPANGTAEWSTNSQRTGAWLQLHWDTPQTIDRVYLYDRPNNADHITGATLTFSDNTTIPVPALNNDGSAT